MSHCKVILVIKVQEKFLKVQSSNFASARSMSHLGVVLFLTEQARSYCGLRTRELGQDPSHASKGDYRVDQPRSVDSIKRTVLLKILLLKKT